MLINLKSIQDTIGYRFNNPDLIQQAFVRRSYSEENGGENNEVLEFIGDKVLDLVVIRIMMEKFGQITDDEEFSEFRLNNPKYFKTKLKEGDFTDIKKDLVDKKALAKCMDRLGFHTQLIMGHGDCMNNVQDTDSVKEDLFEAILGAVALDCNWDMDVLTNVVYTMIDFDAYFANQEVENYVGFVQEWAQQNKYGLPDYQYKETLSGYVCYLTIEGFCAAKGYGSSQAKARKNAAEKVYQYLVENGFIKNDYKQAVGDANVDEALRQINELIQKGLIPKPEYRFKQDYDKDGNIVWTCECMDPLHTVSYTNSASSKKAAQRISAYEMLLDLMKNIGSSPSPWDF